MTDLGTKMNNFCEFVIDMDMRNIQKYNDPLQDYDRPNDLNFCELQSYHESPTALRYKQAYEVFSKARSILQSYPKTTVDTDDDCKFLQPAFHGYAEGDLHENHVFVAFVTKNPMPLIDKYLVLRPNDILAEYYKVCLIVKESFLNRSQRDMPGYSQCKHLGHIISTVERYALKLEKSKEKLDVTDAILMKLKLGVNYKLGSLYTISGQKARAFDSFKKAYSYDKNDFDCLFAVAYHHPILAESIKLFEIFIQQAPHCHKRYYEAFYKLAFIYIRHYQDCVAAKKYYDKGVEAEKEQLPFIPVDMLQYKDIVNQYLVWY